MVVGVMNNVVLGISDIVLLLVIYLDWKKRKWSNNQILTTDFLSVGETATSDYIKWNKSMGWKVSRIIMSFSVTRWIKGLNSLTKRNLQFPFKKTDSISVQSSLELCTKCLIVALCANLIEVEIPSIVHLSFFFGAVLAFLFLIITHLLSQPGRQTPARPHLSTAQFACCG